MLIQRQVWSHRVRYIIANDHGSVLLELYNKRQEFGGRAFIWSLYVIPQYRRQGEAKALMRVAEDIAANTGHDAVYLKYDGNDTPYEILAWYLHSGYEEVAFGDDVYLLKKDLNNEQSTH